MYVWSLFACSSICSPCVLATPHPSHLDPVVDIQYSLVGSHWIGWGNSFPIKLGPSLRNPAQSRKSPDLLLVSFSFSHSSTVCSSSVWLHHIPHILLGVSSILCLHFCREFVCSGRLFSVSLSMRSLLGLTLNTWPRPRPPRPHEDNHDCNVLQWTFSVKENQGCVCSRISRYFFCTHLPNLVLLGNIPAGCATVAVEVGTKDKWHKAGDEHATQDSASQIAQTKYIKQIACETHQVAWMWGQHTTQSRSAQNAQQSENTT